jgi:hypothetical protein
MAHTTDTVLLQDPEAAQALKRAVARRHTDEIRAILTQITSDQTIVNLDAHLRCAERLRQKFASSGGAAGGRPQTPEHRQPDHRHDDQTPNLESSHRRHQLLGRRRQQHNANARTHNGRGSQ